MERRRGHQRREDDDPVSMENGERREGEGDESHPREEEKDTSTFS
jgi:hypothetical protein